MTCIDYRSTTLGEGLPLDVEAGTHNLMGSRFNRK